MGKVKKGRKATNNKAQDSDIEIEDTQNDRETVVAPVKSVPIKAGSNDSSDDDEVTPVRRIQKSFNLLQVEGENDDDDDDEQAKDQIQQENSSDEDIEQIKSKKQTNKQTAKMSKKSKKSRRKKDDSDEEDIDQILAELRMEYEGGDPSVNDTEEVVKKGEKKSKKKTDPEADSQRPDQAVKADEELVTNSAMKTAAQKRKEKKERDKQKRKEAQNELKTEQEPPSQSNIETAVEETVSVPEESIETSKKKSKKKGKDDKEPPASTVVEPKKGPSKKALAVMQEALKKIEEEQERLRLAEEERIRRLEEAETARLEAERLALERKERKKQKDKERKERLKAEGKLLTAKQKADRARAQILIDSLKAQGVDLPGEAAISEKKQLRPFTKLKAKQHQPTPPPPEPETLKKLTEAEVPTEALPPDAIGEEAEEDDVKDAWDISSEEDEEDEGVNNKVVEKADVTVVPPVKASRQSDSEDNDDEPIENARDRAIERIRLRKEVAEKQCNVDDLRAAVVCVLGHVDTGKTKILDKLRRTHVQDGEAGGITQQIGATNVPISAIQEQIKHVSANAETQLKIPGLLIIDTPGHESFSNLRSRGSSLCDIAILVVDIMHGLEPQTLESLQLLRQRKTPFLVALNKIDRLYNWQTMPRKDIRDAINAQAQNTRLQFEQLTKELILQMSEQGLNAALCYENVDTRSYVSLVPTSAITGDGIGNLLALIVNYCQTKLSKRLMYSTELQATVLEVKAIPGLGTTIDVILVNGALREGDTIVCAGTDGGAIVTQIRSLLMPQPMRELRVKNAYVEHKQVKAAQGVKIAAKDLEKAIAGLNMYVAHRPDEVEILRDNVQRELKSALSHIKLQERGVYVQASTLGSLEALLDFLKTSKIPYSGIRIGPVVKRDVMKASIMLEHDRQYAVILAFDVKVERDAMELADSLQVQIFQADIIYHLFDKFTAHRDKLKQQKREEFKHIAVFPCKLKILSQYVFNTRDPIVVGVMVEAGIIKEGTPLCVPTKEFVHIGVVTSIERDHKSVENARKGMEVCIKIDPLPGDTPKMIGRHFEITDMIVSKISRESIDACKDYFRDDLLKSDWQLMVELKKVFDIM